MPDPTPITAQTRGQDPDGPWMSLVRGRVLAIVASGLSLWAAAGPAYQAVQHLWADGPAPEHVAAVLTQTTVVLDSGSALLLALGSAVALAAAAVSKARQWWAHRAPGTARLG